MRSDRHTAQTADSHLGRSMPESQDGTTLTVGDQSVPWWWAESRDDLRFRQEKVLYQREVFRLKTVDHGRVATYTGNRPIETARNGLIRIGSHSRHGFGEIRVKVVSET